MSTPRLELHAIRKSYAGVIANDGIDLTVAPGEIHALLGENGAGKSTLVKVIYGVTRSDSGEMRWEGRPVAIADPRAARALGIGLVFQQFSLFESLRVSDNIALTLHDAPRSALLDDRIRQVSERYGLPINPRRHVYQLSAGERQRVEIVRALLAEPRLLIMDEPTSVLTPQAADALFITLRRLAAEGVSILYISHKLEEIRALCDRATVLRSGRVSALVDPKRESAASLASLMIGRALAENSPTRQIERGPVRLKVHRLSQRTIDPFGTALDDISFDLHAGEVLGIAGVSGNGQRELLAALSGETLASAADAILIADEPVGLLDAAQRRDKGLAYIPEDRIDQGAIAAFTLTDNALLTAHRRAMVQHGWLNRQAATSYAEQVMARFAVKAPGVRAPAQALSGGNLQKFIVGRELMLQPKVLIAAQPTAGVDIGAARFIRSELMAMAGLGCAILVISDDLDELMEISDRVAVLYRGRLTQAPRASEWSREQIGLQMGGAEAGIDARA